MIILSKMRLLLCLIIDLFINQFSQNLFKKHTLKILYIPAYNTKLAPVEMRFSLLKRNLSESNKN